MKHRVSMKKDVNESVYQFKGMTSSDMDELDAQLSRDNVKGTPDFNKMTYTIHKPKKDVYLNYYIMNKYKKFKVKKIREGVKESVNEGTCGYGDNGELGDEPAGPHLLKKKKKVKEACWVGYKQVGMKDKGSKKVPNCVKEIYEIYYESKGKGYGYTFEVDKDDNLKEAEYQGRKVKLGKPMQGDAKKFKVYVKNDKGNVVKVNFGQGGDAKGGTMRIRKDNPKARKSFRARHNCDSPGPRHKARYWSCRKW